MLTASWVKENALNLWDLRDCKKQLLDLPVAKQTGGDSKKGEFLYACKFYSPRTKHARFGGSKSARSTPSDSLMRSLDFSAALACGSGTQSLHLVDLHGQAAKQIDVIECKTPLYCLDVIGGQAPLGACGGVNRLFGIGLNVS